MATVTKPSGLQRGDLLHDAWNVIAGHTSTFLGRIFAFLSSYPPLAQGVYYLLLGTWPLLAGASYQKVTGYHGDLWLFDVVGVLMLAIGGTLCLAAYRRQGSPEVLFLAFGTALGRTIVDIHMVYRGYSVFYLIDAAVQVGLVVFWVFGWKMSDHRTTTLAPLATIVPEPLPPGVPTQAGVPVNVVR